MLSISAWGDGRRVRIGLLGGSFNPAHVGHLAVARRALRRLQLDQVWLMVSPGNPLKSATGMAPFAQRLAAAEALADGRKIVATDIEARLGTRYSVDTLARLRVRFPNVDFVWLMGADGLAQLARWRQWRKLAAGVSMAILPRPPYTLAALSGQAARRLAHYRRPERESTLLASRKPCAWAFLPGPENGISATELRARSSISASMHEGGGPPSCPTGEITIARKPPSDTPPTRRASTAKPAGKNAAVAAKPAARPIDATLAEAAKAPGSPRKKAAVAGPRRKVKREPATTEMLELYLGVITQSLSDDKAEDIVVLDLTGRAAFADRMVIATGIADRQISAMAAHLEHKLGDVGLKRVLIEGANGSDWVLIDAGDIIVHLFKPEARALYGLERMWGAELDEPTGESTVITL